jgi:arylsulfatase A-like enzyme
MDDWLDPGAPSLARMLKENGYATLHSGKWHMGGGRDVGDAPLPKEYGFDDSLTSFEGLGERILIKGNGLSNANAKLGRGEITWVRKHEMSGLFVDRCIAFIREHQDRPFYVQLWPDDVHDPLDPKPELGEKFRVTPYPAYYAVLYELDRQVGRLVEAIDELGLAERTIIIVASDDGPTAWPHYYRDSDDPSLAPGSTGGLRGRKWSLYEGGLRSPLIIRQPGTVPGGVVNEASVIAGMDLLPSLCAIAGIPLPEDYESDGMDMSAALLGKDALVREKAIMWEYGTLQHVRIRPGLEADRSPPLAIREGDWKLLMNVEGSVKELYNLVVDEAESDNVAEAHPEVVERLGGRLLEWWRTMPAAEFGG